MIRVGGGGGDLLATSPVAVIVGYLRYGDVVRPWVDVRTLRFMRCCCCYLVGALLLLGNVVDLVVLVG